MTVTNKHDESSIQENHNPNLTETFKKSFEKNTVMGRYRQAAFRWKKMTSGHNVFIKIVTRLFEDG